MTEPAEEAESATVGVDVVIAVHDAARPIGRAVRSVLDHNGQGVRLTVVCHEVGAQEIAAQLEPGHRDRVRLLEHRDGARSPAGPFNAGIAAANAAYVCLMGSDDQLAAGAISSWYWLAERVGADAVLARLEDTAGHVVHTPPTRPGRRHRLDGVRDRLSYRGAPLGLISRAAIVRLGLRMDETVPVGEDVGFVTRLWFGGRVAFDRAGPPYRVGDDVHDRVSQQDRPVAQRLAFLLRLLGRPWFTALGLEERRAACAMLARVHLLASVRPTDEPERWTAQERRALSEAALLLTRAAPGVESILSLADRELLDRVLDREGTPEELIALAGATRAVGSARTLLTRDPWRVLAREAPLRLRIASALVT